MNLFQVFTTGLDLFTNYRQETGHRNVPQATPHRLCSGSGIAEPRDAGSPGPVLDPETLLKKFDIVSMKKK